VRPSADAKIERAFWWVRMRIRMGLICATRVLEVTVAGLPICDSVNHNDDCTNPVCPVWGNR
jgi:hypothetical protein